MGDQVLFDMRVRRILRESDAIAGALRGVDHLVTADDYDLKTSEANLREAADKIAELRRAS